MCFTVASERVFNSFVPEAGPGSRTKGRAGARV